jgi:hypothetical protein
VLPDELLVVRGIETIPARRPDRAAESTTGNTDLRMFRAQVHATRTTTVHVLSAASEGDGMYLIADSVRIFWM